MSVVIYYGIDKNENHIANGLQGGDINDYISTQETGKILGSLSGLIKALVEDGYVTQKRDENSLYVVSTKNGAFVSFSLTYDSETKEILDVTVNTNGEGYLAILPEDFDTYLKDEDYMFPILSTLGIVE